MLCERCNKNEATVHETTVNSGKFVDKHLCAQCAAAEGVDASVEAPPGSMLHAALAQMAGLPVKKAQQPAPATTKACPSCGLRFEEFKQISLLGCPQCYQTFEAQLGPLLERAHEGATHHVGKIPRRALAEGKREGTAMESLMGSIEERAKRIAALRRQLENAIAAEQFERAARIRDEMSRLGDGQGSQPNGGAEPTGGTPS